MPVYKAEFVRTETYQYIVKVNANSEEEAKEKAYEIYNDADLDRLEHYCLDGNDYLEFITEEV